MSIATTATTQDPPRNEMRKTQILDAAADCFRHSGFHAATIAQISRAAGMSAGHIYHYFENKEAIIAAIVARDLKRLLDMNAAFSGATNVLDAMLECTAGGVRDNLDPRTARLKLEIVAEAARNPRVAEIVQQADRQFCDALSDTLHVLRRSHGFDDGPQHLAACTELLATMFEGLAIRSVRNPALDHRGLAQMFQRVLVEVIAGPPRQDQGPAATGEHAPHAFIPSDDV